VKKKGIIFADFSVFIAIFRRLSQLLPARLDVVGGILNVMLDMVDQVALIVHEHLYLAEEAVQLCDALLELQYLLVPCLNFVAHSTGILIYELKL